jgi:hypothetical protein
MPGTDTCIKIGGYLRTQIEWGAGGGGIVDGSGNQVGQARYNRSETNDFDFRVRTAISVDARSQSEYGTVRSYFRIGIASETPTGTAGGTAGGTFWDRAFIQFAGFTVGKTQSFFDIFTFGGAMSYLNVRTTGDTGASGVALWAYTAQLGNGLSTTLSLEDPNGHGRMAVADLSAAAFTNGGITGDTAFAGQSATNNGFRMPDVVANLRIDQAWGYAAISGVLHEVGGGYYGTPNLTASGHPGDKLGWAVALGAQFNVPGLPGDKFGFQLTYAEGATSYITNSNVWSIYNSSTSVGLAWVTDGVFDTGTSIELTRGWSINAAYEHIWTPQLRTSLYGGFAKIDYSATATNMINAHLPGTAGTVVCGVPVAGAVSPPVILPAGGGGNSCNPDFSFWQVGSRTQWNPHKDLDIGLDVLYTHLNTAYKGPGVVAAPAGSPRSAVGLVDDQNVWTFMFRVQRNFLP